MRKNKSSGSDWIYNGQPFSPDNIKELGYHGFVYIIKDLVNGKRYIGKKSFWSTRKLKSTDKRRTTVESNWKKYWSSSETIKELIKEHGHERFEREIIALCKLERDMNYLEVKYQFHFAILENGDQWYNENINGCWFPHLYKDISSRVEISTTIASQ